MPNPRTENWVEENTSTTGAGPVTVGNPRDGRTTFKQAFGAGVTQVEYSIENGENQETGVGSYDGATDILTRTTVEATLTAGVYDNVTGTPLTLVGSSIVRCMLSAETFASTSKVFTDESDPSAKMDVGDTWIPPA